ncbi:polyprenyl synthetase family protein [Fundicoccus sp. Sow4_F4]|uniref:polyprenyl synthetase family protein n=1 Tax=Fundicoccus sp. Sow4_F4 TaxID=3438783 RepID=UPI003F8EC93D
MVHAIWQDYPEIEAALREVKEIIHQELAISSPSIRDIIRDYIDASGKYIRAGLCIMFAKLNYGSIPREILYSAAAIEMLHLATLIHDDVIDEADSRRGVKAIHKQHSNRIAIYAGDYLLAYSARLFKEAHKLYESTSMDDWVIERILDGEISQLENQFEQSISIYQYLRQIRGKTAMLFALSVFSGSTRPELNRFKSRQAFYIGLEIGMAFQLSDDLIDYQIDQRASGKPQLQDVQNGIYTAPLILAMEEETFNKQLIHSRGHKWTENELTALVNEMEKFNVFNRTNELVDSYLKKSLKKLDKLSSQQSKDEIRQLLNAVMKRNF